MRRLLGFLVNLVFLVLIIFVLTAAWIIFDGLSDLGEKADVALVTGRLNSPWDQAAQPKLDRAIQLFNEQQFRSIIVSVAGTPSAENEPDAMAHYLEAHGVPAESIIIDRHGDTTLGTAQDTAEIMKLHDFKTVMLITDYYRVTRLKLCLIHDGVSSIAKSHLGALHKADAPRIGREIIALYDAIAKFYILPEATKVKQEADVGAAQARVEAEKAKEKVDKSLDNLSK